MKTHHFYVGKETGHITWTVKIETGSLMFLGQILHGDLSYDDVLSEGKQFLDDFNNNHIINDFNMNGYYMSEFIRPCEYRHRELTSINETSLYRFYHYCFNITSLSPVLTKYFDIIDADSGRLYAPIYEFNYNDNGIFIILCDVLAENKRIYVKKLTYENMEYFIFHRSSIDFEFEPLNLSLRFI